jgi:outer membrane receptor protein involved in Fe transport
MVKTTMSGKKYLVQICGLFAIISIQINAQSDTTGTSKLFSMSFNDLMNQEVITSSRFSQRFSEAASAVSVITSEEIKLYGYSTLGEALYSQRGMYLSNDKNYLYLGSRGFSRPTDYNNRIVVMVDEHIMNEIVYGSAFMGNELGINIKNVDRIEIIRGPGASVYGSGAMLNTINIITKSGKDLNGVQLDAGAGSFGRGEFSAIYGSSSNGFDYTLSGSAGISKGEDYFYPELDKSDHNYGNSIGLDWEKFTNLQGKVNKGNLSISGLLSSRLKGIPTGAFNTDFSKDDFTKDNRYYLETDYKINLGKQGTLSLRAYFDNYYYKGSYPTAGEGWYDRSNGSWTGAEAQYLLKKRNNIFTSGLEYKYIFESDYKEWQDVAVYFDKNFPFSMTSLYAQDQYTLFSKVSLTAGLRYDSYDQSENALSPRFAMVYKYHRNSFLKVLYNHAFRYPNMYESHYESEIDHKSNPDIKPERIRAAEVEWGQEFSAGIFYTMSGYYYQMFDLIDQTLDESDGLTVFTNIGKATGYGIESEIRYQPDSGPRGYLNYSYQKTVDNETDKVLSNSPQNLFKAGLIFPFAKRFYLTPEFRYESGRMTLQGNKTGDVYLCNLSLRISEILGHLDINLKVRNIFNIKYGYPGGYEHVQDRLLQDSRSIFIQLSAKF